VVLGGCSELSGSLSLAPFLPDAFLIRRLDLGMIDNVRNTPELTIKPGYIPPVVVVTIRNDRASPVVAVWSSRPESPLAVKRGARGAFPLLPWISLALAAHAASTIGAVGVVVAGQCRLWGSGRPPSAPQLFLSTE
jgi:hypothetical protein